MIRTRHTYRLATACSAALLLLLTACGGSGGSGGDGPSGGSTTAGKPVTGGSARILQLSEPASLDPAHMANQWAINGVIGNALYGTLLISDAKTSKVSYKMATSFTTEDNGRTFELRLRDGLKFTDGTPLDAAAVKFNWDRLKDPSLGAFAFTEASLISATKVVDATTLRATLTEPVPRFAQAVSATALNWIASPTALKTGRKAYDAKPVGAGPYTLTKWARQDSLTLARNPDYYDKPKPYLDTLTLRTALDGKQRLDTMTTGGADVAMESSWENLAKAKAAGLPTTVVPLNGGLNLTMNTRRAPFDDLRARQALAAALDITSLNQTVSNGTAEVADTLFVKSSPFHADIPLAQTDKTKAQKLFDTLAAEGKPVSFQLTTFPSSDSKIMAESVQTQLSQFKNVKVEIKTVDYANLAAMRTKHDFDMTVDGALFGDPETRLLSTYSGESTMNMSGIADKELSAALLKGRTATDQAERKAAYETVQKRLVALVPAVFVDRAAPAAITGKNVHGVVEYGDGSLLPEELWIKP
ncbi:ABC transporter substrate-binding protein [Streptomyces sp. NPDC059893]|uniref:ABC transporter substrate-binding protein n=1 Tax=Streptomyces sp. NPDC059893 TaxID=3346990 RepID=UPI00364BAAB0